MSSPECTHVALVLQQRNNSFTQCSSRAWAHKNIELKKTTKQQQKNHLEFSKYLVSRDIEMNFLFDCFTLRIFLELCIGILDAQ